jgi:hypothetical protein
MSASNWNPVLKLFHDRLKGAGKLPKVVIVAVMRIFRGAYKSFVITGVLRHNPPLAKWETVSG